jgi:hypothetical protein
MKKYGLSSYLCVFTFLLFEIALDLNADCTMTTQQGTNGRCFLVHKGGTSQFKCLPRDEDTHCFIDEDETIDP